MVVAHTGQIPGNYSISICSSMPWKGKAVPREPKKNKKTVRPILYPLFENCAKLTEDPYWKTKFMDCAKGRFPRGYTYKNNLLTHKKGNKLTKLELSDSMTEVFIATMKFFQMTSGLLSQRDRKKLQEIEEEKILEEMENVNELTWRDIKAEKYREMLLSEFINSVSTRMKFDEEEKREMITTVKKGLMLKYFNADNIIMEEGKITEIQGLFYNKEKNRYEIDKDYIKEVERYTNGLGLESEADRPEVDFIKLWEKYLESLQNKRIKKSTYSSSTLHESALSDSLYESMNESIQESLNESEIINDMSESITEELSMKDSKTFDSMVSY